MYAVGQCADILAFRPASVPVGEDQVAHIEMCREVARRFNQVYCGVDPHAEDAEHERLGGVFPVPSALVGKVGRLVGTDGTQKMSKSLNNAIFLSDTPKQVKKKINAMYPGQSRNPDEPGDPEINPVFEYAETFIADSATVDEMKDRYRRGDNLGDGHVKAAVIEAINELLEPMRERRAALEGDAGDERVVEIIKAGTARANAAAEETLHRAKDAMGLGFGERRLGWASGASGRA
jgi:tryptophanyl-tRNA synthetase